jgi:putative Ca2+/H+ antiporter (TMEM165/GDT1 family)
MVKIAIFEVGELVILDRILCMFILIAFILAVRFRKDINSQIFLGVLLSVWVIGAINGTVGVNFRYQLPVIPFGCVLIAKWFQNLDPKKITFLSKNQREIL